MDPERPVKVVKKSYQEVKTLGLESDPEQHDSGSGFRKNTLSGFGFSALSFSYILTVKQN
jgi:hypothetical protein